MLALPLLLAALQTGSHAAYHPAEADLFVEAPELGALREPYGASAIAQLASDPFLQGLMNGGTAPASGQDAAENWQWLEELVRETLSNAPIPAQVQADLLSMMSGLDGASMSISGLAGSLEARSAGAAQAASTFASLGVLEGELALHASPDRWGSLPDELGELPELPDDARFDAWGHPWSYERTGETTYRLRSFGADGAPGGTGAASDIESGMGLEAAVANVSLGGVRFRLILAFRSDESLGAALQLLEASGAQAFGDTGDVWTLPVQADPAPLVRVERDETRLAFDVSLSELPALADARLATHADYTSARTHLEAPGATVWQGYWRMNPSELIAMLPEDQLDFDRGPLLALARELFGASPEASVWRTGIRADGRLVKESFAASGSIGSGMSRWLRHKPVSEKVRGWIPADTIGFYAASMDPAYVFDRCLETASATFGMERDDLMSLAESAAGVPVDEELISSLGDSFAMCFDLAGLGPPKVRAYAELADPDAFTEAFGALWDAGTLLVDKEVAKLSRRTYRKVDLFTVSPGGGGMGVPQPTFAILGDRLLFTLSSSHAKKEVKRLGAGEEQGQHPALAETDLQGGHSLTYMDWGALLGGVYELGRTFGSMFGVWESIGIDSAELPEASRLTAPFAPTIGFSAPVKDGLYARRESSLGPELAVLPVLAGAGFLVAAAETDEVFTMEEAALPPKPAKPPGSGPVETTQASLRRLKTDLKIYQLQNSTFPELLEDLARPSSDYPDGILTGGAVPQDAWKQDLRYERTGSGYRLYSVGPDGVDQAGSGDDVAVD